MTKWLFYILHLNTIETQISLNYSLLNSLKPICKKVTALTTLDNLINDLSFSTH